MIGARPVEGREAVPRAFDGGRLDAFTWLGLAVAALGWVVLVVAVAFADHLVQRDLASTPGRLHADVLAVGECLIGSGLAFAMIGTLRTGFGALNRFFAAALDRSASRTVPVATAQTASIQGEPAKVEPAKVEPVPPQRNRYTILADGSVEVDTILGTRRFATMAEARDFI